MVRVALSKFLLFPSFHLFFVSRFSRSTKMEFYYTSQDPAEIARQVFERLQVCDSNSSQSSCYGDYKRSTSVARPPDGSAHRPFRRYGSPLARDDSKPFVESKSSSVKSNKIPPPNLDLYEEGIPVIIGEVNTLNNFYLIINSIDLEFEELNDEMASFYVNRESCTNVQVDGFYAAKDPDGGNWCRVQVIYKSDTVYTCFFVDYGATKCVPLDALYTLEESFIKQPQRSFKASLEGKHCVTPSLYYC